MVTSVFQTGWWGTDLQEYRPTPSTYGRYPYESLPPLDDNLFDGEFRWLGANAEVVDTMPDALSRLVNDLAKVGLSLPPAFLRFFADPTLGAQVPSCTACYWSLAEVPVPSPVEDGAFIVRFLNDQQGCLFWYLYLTPNGDSFVLCSPILFDDYTYQWEDGIANLDEVLAESYVCAPGFEHFVYRFWLENRIWYAINDPHLSEGEVWYDGEDNDELTPPQREYLAHYRPDRIPL